MFSVGFDGFKRDGFCGEFNPLILDFLFNTASSSSIGPIRFTSLKASSALPVIVATR
jgi:hypothetical protein